MSEPERLGDILGRVLLELVEVLDTHQRGDALAVARQDDALATEPHTAQELAELVPRHIGGDNGLLQPLSPRLASGHRSPWLVWTGYTVAFICRLSRAGFYVPQVASGQGVIRMAFRADTVGKWLEVWRRRKNLSRAEAAVLS